MVINEVEVLGFIERVTKIQLCNMRNYRLRKFNKYNHPQE